MKVLLTKLVVDVADVVDVLELVPELVPVLDPVDSVVVESVAPIAGSLGPWRWTEAEAGATDPWPCAPWMRTERSFVAWATTRPSRSVVREIRVQVQVQVQIQMRYCVLEERRWLSPTNFRTATLARF